jgi:hypothetical protein
MLSGRVFWRIWMIRERGMGVREGNRWKEQVTWFWVLDFVIFRCYFIFECGDLKLLYASLIIA